MGVKKVKYSDLSPAGKWMRNNPSKVKSQPSRNKPLSAKDKRDKVESQKERRKATREGRDIKDKDWDHATGKFESVKFNRGEGHKMKPGSKEKDSPTTFRMDSPLKALGFGDDTATASQQAYANPSVSQGNAARTPMYYKGVTSATDAIIKKRQKKANKETVKALKKALTEKDKKK